MAFLTRGAIFVHIPKTAGQWVVSALERSGVLVGTVGVVHAAPDEIASEPPALERSAMFAFVRHPLSWYRSMWSHRMDENWSPIDDPEWFTPAAIEQWATFTERCRSKRFPEFVERCLSEYPDGFVSDLYRRYTEGCTQVGKQEKAADDLLAILRQLGEDVDSVTVLSTLPLNVRGESPARKREALYTPGLAASVMEAEAWAIGRFGYQDIPDGLLVPDGSSADHGKELELR